MAFLILADASDTTAIAVAALLMRRHGAARVELRAADEIALAPRWDHRLSRHAASTEIRLHDGKVLASDTPWTVFNRISRFAPPVLPRGSAEDRAYAQTEMFALMLSWLTAAGHRVINRPTPTSLVGCAYRPLEWRSLAARAGLPTSWLAATTSTRRFKPPALAVARSDLSWRYSMADEPLRPNTFCWYSNPPAAFACSVLVIGSRVFGPAPQSIHDPCRRLARLAGADILRIDLSRSERANNGYDFAGADACPAVDDPAALRALVELLECAGEPVAIAEVA